MKKYSFINEYWLSSILLFFSDQYMTELTNSSSLPHIFEYSVKIHQTTFIKTHKCYFVCTCHTNKFLASDDLPVTETYSALF